MPAHKMPFNNQPNLDILGFLNKTSPLQTKNDLLGIRAPQYQSNSYQKVLQFYGVHTDQSGDEFIGDCPFSPCREEGKSGKFTTNTQTGQLRCFVCGVKGNMHSFIQQLHRYYLARTTAADYEKLRIRRSLAIDTWIMEEMQLALNGATNEWLIPAWSASSPEIGNLYAYKQSYDEKTAKPFMQILSGPTFKHTPYGIHRLRQGTNRPIWVLEGHWDYLAFGSLLRRLGEEPRFDYIASPGADTFPKSYLGCFNGREVVIAYDNDVPGRNGVASLMNNMAHHSIMPQSISVVEWPSTLPDKFDVSDAIVKLPKELWK